jgi:UDP-N-acetylglucosamine 2-epimerase (non-hydrolysing)
MKLILVVGARPNFMKIAPIIDAIHEHNRSTVQPIHYLLVHSGQHYDERMSNLFFNDLGIPEPDINLEVGSGSHAEQTAEIMKRIEKVFLNEKPTHVLVVGDVNSTLACALVASKMNIKVVHVEAGLRSFDRSMPEEINRVLTDAVSDYLLTTEESAERNLLQEGIPKENIYFVGNVMIDTLMKFRQKADESPIPDQLLLKEGNKDFISYGLLTLHRPSNVDDGETFENIMGALIEISRQMPIIFPAHPRTMKKISEFGLEKHFIFDRTAEKQISRIYCIEPLGYLDFLALMSHASIVLTDSGGIQEETTVLRIPCVTLRENTERPVTVTHGTNIIAGTRKNSILKAFLSSLNKSVESHQKGREKLPPLWDGSAAKRIIDVLISDCKAASGEAAFAYSLNERAGIRR